ncbi:hypothetical protein [Streptomyces mirabilis]
MDPVTVGAVVTVAASVVNGIVKIAQRQLNAEVEIARIAEAAQTDRAHCVISWALILGSSPDGHAQLAGPAEQNGGDCHGGCPQR